MKSILINEVGELLSSGVLASVDPSIFLTEVDVYDFRNPPENVRVAGHFGENCRIIARSEMKFAPNMINIACMYHPRGQRNDISIVFLAHPGVTNFVLYGGSSLLMFSEGVQNFNSRICAWNNCGLLVGPHCTSGGSRLELSNSEIIIGSNCLFADETLLQSHDGHGIVDLDTMEIINEGRGRISIGDQVWIGRRATLLRDVTVGRGSVISNSAVVTRDVEAWSLAAGVPARIVRNNVSWCHDPAVIADSERAFFAGFLEDRQPSSLLAAG